MPRSHNSAAALIQYPGVELFKKQCRADAYQNSVNGASEAKMIVRPDCVVRSARKTAGKSLRTPSSVLSTKKLGNATRNVTSSSSGTLAAE